MVSETRAQRADGKMDVTLFTFTSICSEILFGELQQLKHQVLFNTRLTVRSLIKETLLEMLQNVIFSQLAVSLILIFSAIYFFF